MLSYKETIEKNENRKIKAREGKENEKEKLTTKIRVLGETHRHCR